jgi:hypothetical protein
MFSVIIKLIKYTPDFKLGGFEIGRSFKRKSCTDPRAGEQPRGRFYQKVRRGGREGRHYGRRREPLEKGGGGLPKDVVLIVQGDVSEPEQAKAMVDRGRPIRR